MYCQTSRLKKKKKHLVALSAFFFFVLFILFFILRGRRLDVSLAWGWWVAAKNTTPFAKGSISGSGWEMTQFNFAGPGKSESVNIDMSGEGQETNWTATAPGTWHFRVTSGPCTRVFDVEVKPVP